MIESMKNINEDYVGTKLIVTEVATGEVDEVDLENGSGYNGARGRNTYVRGYYISLGINDAFVQPAQNLSTIVRRIEKELNRDALESDIVTVALK